jgi:putative methionine-R-sulfoxide reductase with GAF domain
MTEPTSDRLSDLLAVTDTPPRLDDDLLQELLQRVRRAFDVDTAAILLSEGASGDLVARAACGLEDEVRQGVKVPIGTGFAGTIAATKRPVFLDRVDETTVANPILWEKGIRVMLGVPLLTNNRVMGVLHIGRFDHRGFTEHDADLLQVAADRIVNVVQIERFAAETAAARMLERSLLPASLPRLPQIHFAARYVPAEGRAVGGDWYDVFTSPSGTLWVVIGDVAGHGLAAAVVMGRVKSALRAYALQSDRPDEVLELTDTKVQHFEMGAMVTVACAVAQPPYQHFELCSAGHPPPMLAAPGRETALLPVRPGPPLGVRADVRRSSTGVDLPDGAVLLYYTDGLVERRERDLDDGLETLRLAVHPGPAEIVCRDVMHELVGNTAPADDIAIIAVQRGSDPPLHIPCQLV